MRIFILCLGLALLGAKCGGGDGSGGDPPIFQITNADPECLTIAGPFPSGFDLLPGGGGEAAVVQSAPSSLLGLDIDPVPPALLAQSPIPSLPPDSDGDGVDDAVRSQEEGFFPLTPILGPATAAGVATAVPGAPDLVLVSASNYEEALFFDPATGALVPLRVENPTSTGSYVASDYPFLPPEGTSADRTALSTRACVFPPSPQVAVDSLGDPIAPEPRCDPDLPGYFTNLTAGTAVASGRLFVATSNLASAGERRFNPGTILVYELDLATSPPAPAVKPDVEVPIVFTTGFNPTNATAHTNALGRELVLVTVTGAIGAGVGNSNVLTDGAVDVIDAASRTLVATIPLGLAGSSFGEIAIDPAGQVGLLGATSERHLYAVDLRALDDPALFPPPGGVPVVLDGSTPGFPDARIFTAASPFTIPARDDGPAPQDCAGLTHVDVNATGTQAFATDFCDGTLSVVALDLVDLPAIPAPQSRFRLNRVERSFAPNVPESLTKLRTPGIVRVRAGLPGVDYTGPDVFVVVGQPDGAVCGLRIESL